MAKDLGKDASKLVDEDHRLVRFYLPEHARWPAAKEARPVLDTAPVGVLPMEVRAHLVEDAVGLLGSGSGYLMKQRSVSLKEVFLSKVCGCFPLNKIDDE